MQEVKRLKRNVRAFMKVRSHYPRAGGTLMECLLCVQEYNVKDLGAFIFDNPTHQHHDLYHYIGELVLLQHTHTHIHSKSSTHMLLYTCLQLRTSSVLSSLSIERCFVCLMSPTMLEGQCTIPSRLLVHLFPNVATGGAKTRRKSC